MALRGCPCCNRGHRCITAPGIATTSRHLPRAIADSAIDPTEGLFMRLTRFTTLLLLALLALLVSGCADRQPAQPAKAPKATQEHFSQSGKASYYARMHHGQRTANGETHDQNALVAAHRSLPFGTRVRVTNEHNGKQVVVRINDRGPFRRGRIIDLSRAAAAQLDMLKTGVIRVRIETLP